MHLWSNYRSSNGVSYANDFGLMKKVTEADAFLAVPSQFMGFSAVSQWNEHSLLFHSHNWRTNSFHLTDTWSLKLRSLQGSERRLQEVNASDELMKPITVKKVLWKRPSFQFYAKKYLMRLKKLQQQYHIKDFYAFGRLFHPWCCWCLALCQLSQRNIYCCCIEIIIIIKKKNNN